MISIMLLCASSSATEGEPEFRPLTAQQRGGATLPLGYGVGSDEGGFTIGVMGSVGDGLVGVPVWLLGTNLARTGGFFMLGIRVRPPVVPVFADALLGWTKVSETDGAGLSAGGAAGVELALTREFAITAGGALGARFDGGTWGCGFVGPTLLF